MVWPAVLIVALIVLKVLCEHAAWAQYLERRTYEIVQGRLFAGGTRNRPQVLVIDLGKIQPKQWQRDGYSGRVTPRSPLKDLLEVFTDSELKARAVGIDVDFSPKDGRFMHPDDPEFFSWCLARSEETNVPIWLGVYRTQTQPYNWLGDDRFMRLAATIATPAVAHGRAVHWIMSKKGRVPLPSMSAALAGANVTLNISDRPFWSWAVDSASIVERADNLRSAESAIDFAPLQRMQEDELPALEPAVFRALGDKIKDRIILLGDAHPGDSDSFLVPGIPKRVPGVYLHACGANTISGAPLYQLTLAGRIAIDLLLALLIVVLVQGSLWLLKRFRHVLGRAEEILSLIFTFMVIAVVTIVSIYTVRLTRLLWTDFVLVCFVLLVQLIIDTIRCSRHSSTASP